MKNIALEKWRPSEEDPRKLEYVGQPTAQEVFEELKHRLESIGYLPDEYFLMDTRWEDGREIPWDADIFCTADYGGSEGVYLDAYLQWPERNQLITRKFFTGKTLGESGNDLDRMFLISSAITKAFHGDRAAQARYMRIGGVEEDAGGAVVHLSQQEQKTIIEALVEQRERQEQAMGQTERLLRRMTGSITEYVNTVGMRPLRLSDYDKAILAIQDGELSAFKELYPKVLADHGDGLLAAAAGRPGMVGRQMTSLLLAEAETFSAVAYRAACEGAIDINDPEKVRCLLEQAEGLVPDLPLSFYGEMACQAYADHRAISREIVQRCTPEQIAAAPPHLLSLFALGPDCPILELLTENGISSEGGAAETLHRLTYQGQYSRIAEELLKNRMWVNTKDLDALHACVQNDAVEVCKLLLDGGMDFDQYRQWAKARRYSGHEETLAALAEHWTALQNRTQEAPAHTDGGMTLA